MSYTRKRANMSKKSKSDYSVYFLVILISLGCLLGIFKLTLIIVESFRLSDILFYSLLGTLIVYYTVKGYLKIQRFRFETKKCIHKIVGGETLNKCAQCIDEKKKQSLEEERIEKENQLLYTFQLESRKMERNFLEKLESIRNTSIEYLQNIDPYEFEKIIGKLFHKLGYKVTLTPKSNDKGKDLILTKKGQKILVECKRYAVSNKIGRPELQKFYAAIIEEKADFGFFVTSSDFTSTSESYVKDINNQIKLINGMELIDLMKYNFPNEGKDERFTLKCRYCGENVQFGYPFESIIKCPNNHKISTSAKLIKTRLLREEMTIAPKCPKCQAEMERRRSKRFKSVFWGCSNYPNCFGRLPFKISK